ncbi:unnamed protein product [Closterium sp. Naga37s-1]|nr:unnamed protein product [Closterium sp. Naga37s-1]
MRPAVPSALSPVLYPTAVAQLGGAAKGSATVSVSSTASVSTLVPLCLHVTASLSPRECLSVSTASLSPRTAMAAQVSPAAKAVAALPVLQAGVRSACVVGVSVGGGVAATQVAQGALVRVARQLR